MTRNASVQKYVKSTPVSQSAKRGFTLIELSIVLVIVGLIVGGILVGQDMIRLAEIRATVGQIEKFNAATNAFQTKYNALPGDIHYTNASAFGLFTFTGADAGKQGFGDGNGIIEAAYNAFPADPTKGRGEPLVFWRHLSEAQLVEGNYGVTGNAALDSTTGGVLAAVDDNFISNLMPQAKIGNGSFFPVYIFGSRHYFEFHALRRVAPDGWYDSRTTLLLQPMDAFQLDTKMDDGRPNTGAVVARGQANLNAGSLNQPPNNGASINCVLGSNPLSPVDPEDTYDNNNTQSACSLRIPFN